MNSASRWEITVCLVNLHPLYGKSLCLGVGWAFLVSDFVWEVRGFGLLGIWSIASRWTGSDEDGLRHCWILMRNAFGAEC